MGRPIRDIDGNWIDSDTGMPLSPVSGSISDNAQQQSFQLNDRINRANKALNEFRKQAELAKRDEDLRSYQIKADNRSEGERLQALKRREWAEGEERRLKAKLLTEDVVFSPINALNNTVIGNLALNAMQPSTYLGPLYTGSPFAQYFTPSLYDDRPWYVKLINDEKFGNSELGLKVNGITDIVGSYAIPYGAAKALSAARKGAVIGALDLASRTWDGKTVPIRYFQSPSNWYRWSQTPEVLTLKEVGHNITTRDALDLPNYGSQANAYRMRAFDPSNDAHLIVKDGSYYLDRNFDPYKISAYKLGSAHGNKTLAAYGLLWNGGTAQTPGFPIVVIEGGYQPQFLAGVGNSRSNFRLTNIEDIPLGHRIGFNTGDIKAGENISSFRMLGDKLTPKTRFLYEGPILLDKIINVEPKVVSSYEPFRDMVRHDYLPWKPSNGFGADLAYWSSSNWQQSVQAQVPAIKLAVLNATNFINSDLRKLVLEHNTLLAQRLGFDVGDALNKVHDNFHPNVGKINISSKDFVGKNGYPNGVLGSTSLSQPITLAPFTERMDYPAYHEALHLRNFGGISPRYTFDPEGNLIGRGITKEQVGASEAFGDFLTQHLLNKKIDYNGLPISNFELATNLRDIGNRMGIEPGAPYPGNVQFMKMLNTANNYNGNLLFNLRLDKPKRVWRALNGTYYKQGGKLNVENNK